MIGGSNADHQCRRSAVFYQRPSVLPIHHFFVTSDSERRSGLNRWSKEMQTKLYQKPVQRFD